MDTIDRAQDRWDEIMEALGHSDAMNRKHAPCKACGGVDRYRYVGGERGGAFCGDARMDGFGLLKHITGKSDAEVFTMIESVIGKLQRPFSRKQETYADILRSRAVKAERSAYLESRGLCMSPVLRFCREVKYFDDGKAIGTFDAMLAPITKEGRFLTYQVTYLRNGKKANVSAPRKILESHGGISGGAVELYACTGDTLGVAEGVETAMSATSMFAVPCWAVLNTSGMKTFNPPDSVKRLVIFADNDENYAGHASAYHLAHRMKLKGLEVAIYFPEDVGTDWNDQLIKEKQQETL